MFNLGVQNVEQTDLLFIHVGDHFDCLAGSCDYAVVGVFGVCGDGDKGALLEFEVLSLFGRCFEVSLVDHVVLTDGVEEAELGESYPEGLMAKSHEPGQWMEKV